MFKDIALIVHDQGEMIGIQNILIFCLIAYSFNKKFIDDKDTIEGNISNTELTVMEANVQLTDAKTYKVRISFHKRTRFFPIF